MKRGREKSREERMEDTHVGMCRKKRCGKGGDKEMEGRIEDRQKGREAGRMEGMKRRREGRA